MAAVSYDTATRKSKVAGSSVEPVLKGRPNPAPALTRTTLLNLQSSAKADLRLTEMYQTTIDEFKKKLYEQKQEIVLSRINNQFKDSKDVIQVSNANTSA